MAKSKELLRKVISQNTICREGANIGGNCRASRRIAQKIVGVWAKEGESERLPSWFINCWPMTVAALLNSINAAAEAAAKDGWGDQHEGSQHHAPS